MMEEEKKLYPFRFCSLVDEYSWGTDSFLLADLGYRDSLVKEGWLAGNTLGEVMDMFMDRVVGDSVFEFYGRQFPFQLKMIHAKGRMPLRVHPDDETASQRYDFLGREKLWYVVKASSDAKLIIGFEKDADASEVYEGCLDGKIAGLLHEEKAVAGNWYHIRPGVPHAACGDVQILEVSESSPLDFCMCGWGEPVSTDEFDTALDLVDALDFIDYKAWRNDAVSKSAASTRKLISLPQFTVNSIALSSPVKVKMEKFDSCVAYTCVGGTAVLQTEIEGLGNAGYELGEGDTILIPADVAEYALVPKKEGTVLLEVMLDKPNPLDLYINPDAPATLPGEEEDDNKGWS